MNDDRLTAALDPAGLAGPTSSAPAGRCLVGRILDTVNDANRKRIITILHSRPGDDAWMPQEHLARRICAGGYRVSQAALSKHRRRGCNCTSFESENA